MQSPDKVHIDRAIARMKNAGLNVLIMPDLADIIENKKIEPRPFDLKDLIRRPPRQNVWETIRNRFHQQVILITGAGGSIGSELVRQIISCNPKKLILIDSCEFNLYRIEMELANYCDVEKVAILGSITDSILVDKICSAHTPFAVFHAAAYKHVPIVEANPHIGILNNIGGTKIIADAAVRYNCEHFLLISTDKAVRPTNIMGATKRCCELMIQAYDALYENCRFSAVRFGNVLGSSGSVVPHFQKQINEGGPVTVTHRDISRFFMLTEEAVTLILQAVTMARGGEIFVLDMGKPIKIYDLAIQMIELAGKIPGKDVEIAITQLRPGEKLNEELFIDGVEEPTQCTDILISKSPQRDWLQIISQINEILLLTQSGKQGDPVKFLWQLVKDDHEKKEKCTKETDANILKKKNTEAPERWAPIG
jgi:FlaA1/EpsC-like NDP-sugar epimerase